MARPRSAFTLWSQYLAARLGDMLVNMRSPEVNLRMASGIGDLLWRFDKRHRNRAARNIAMALPQLPAEEQVQIVRDSFHHLARLAVEVMHTPRHINPQSWTRRAALKLDEMSPVVEMLNAHRPLLLLTGHVGNWEVMGTLLALLGYPIHALARPLDNPLVNDWVAGIREKRGLSLITKWDATDRMVEIIDRGGVLGFIADQNAGDRGLFVPFFGKLASTYKSIGLLAIAKNLPVVCGYTVRTELPLQYVMGVADIIYPDDWAGQRNPLYYVTARFMRGIETIIRRYPPQYLWLHRRWKSRPRHERENQPMPSSLRRNLEDLPWMDQPTLDSLMQPLPPEINQRK
ncbi:MAG: lysophospholipid acyltransferase family protein [Phycisphaeraceae bacterium]|nr:lysophospholipid acyltransferase family protein [Phycisphaeraceae bacterium]